jgi:putative holliday junction resolvase
MRHLGIDCGEKRVGLAVSDPLGMIATPFAVLPMRNDESMVDDLKRIISEQNVEKIVVGLPLNMNGTRGPMAEKCAKFAALLEKATGLAVELCDERLSTTSAEKALIEADMRREKRKGIRDKVAAQIILQSYLDRQSMQQG